MNQTLPTARELMEPHVLSVSPEASLLDVHQLFTDEEISGAPVVDETGALVGVVTATDLVRAVGDESGTVRFDRDYFRDILEYYTPDWSAGPKNFEERLETVRVSEVMTNEVVTIAPDTPASEIATLLRERHIHRAFVTAGQQLLGIVTAFDLLKVLESLKD
jgi:CBS domain-containing protein